MKHRLIAHPITVGLNTRYFRVEIRSGETYRYATPNGVLIMTEPMWTSFRQTMGASQALVGVSEISIVEKEEKKVENS